MELSTRARRRLSTVLALILAAESVSSVSVAAASVGGQRGGEVEASVATTQAVPARLVPATFEAIADDSTPPAFALHVVEPVDPPAAPAVVKPAAPRVTPARNPKAGTKPAAKPTKNAASKPSKPKPAPRPAAKPAPKPAPKPTPKPTSFSGTNHVWIPSLGISRSVHSFPCSRTRPPDNYMYRWGCAGANNVYLMGHAYSVMAPLHDAYVSGRLKVGMKAFYAGADGKVHEYVTKWWKLTRPTTDAAWAWAAQSVPSMTLQTCVGAQSQWRLMVRLVEVNG